MEFQPVAQRELPSPAVILDQMTLDHLRLGVELRIVAVERVVDRQRKIARDVGRRPDRVERGEVAMRREGYRGRGLRAADPRRRQSRGSGQCRFQKIASLHLVAGTYAICINHISARLLIAFKGLSLGWRNVGCEPSESAV